VVRESKKSSFSGKKKSAASIQVFSQTSDLRGGRGSPIVKNISGEKRGTRPQGRTARVPETNTTEDEGRDRGDAASRQGRFDKKMSFSKKPLSKKVVNPCY